MRQPGTYMIRRAASVGMFDGVHRGHQMVIEYLCDLANERGLIPTAFTFLRHPLSIIAPDREPKIITTAAQRTDLLIDAGAKDVHLLVFDHQLRNLTAKQFLTLLHNRYGVDLLVVGFNNHFGKDRIGDFDAYRNIGCSVGIEVVQAPQYIDGDITVSSSVIRALVSDGDMVTANNLLGHDFAIAGEVGHGIRIGATIGFPTANIKPYLQNQLIPKMGAYAAYINVKGANRLPAMINIGCNPTVNADTNQLSIEANIFGFADDIYGWPIEARFVARLRDERKFDSLQQLTEQLHIDRQAALELLS